MVGRVLPQRRKAWHSKARTGCKTCKARHLKCSEEKPQCQRCIRAGKSCGGYADNPKPWIFDPWSDRADGRCGSLAATASSEESISIVPLSDCVFTSPYTTREAQAALEFWLRLTTPEGTDCPGDIIRNTLGSYVPQAAWHLDVVRHSLLSAASTALVLEARASNMSLELQSTLSKQSVIQMHLAIQAILKERQPSLSTVLAAVMIAVVCVWTGRWEEYSRHICYCRDLGREVRARGDYVEGDLTTSVETMFHVLQPLPPISAMTGKSRMKYAVSILVSAKTWVDGLLPRLEPIPKCEPLKTALRAYRTRMKWTLCQWQRVYDQGEEQASAISVAESPFGPAVEHMQQYMQDDSDFNLPLLTTQLTLGFKTTLLYGASGDAQRMRDTAIACHAPVLALASHRP
ncbi:Fungal Zn2-Cys6 binuclear cluster domain-containing protein [Cladophialophora immunda]|nr:Fungal Zn2-Cys6 binuclear cluster domain-containing protein [Cladophialophora immunda]